MLHDLPLPQLPNTMYLRHRIDMIAAPTRAAIPEVSPCQLWTRRVTARICSSARAYSLLLIADCTCHIAVALRPGPASRCLVPTRPAGALSAQPKCGSLVMLVTLSSPRAAAGLTAAPFLVTYSPGSTVREGPGCSSIRQPWRRSVC